MIWNLNFPNNYSFWGVRFATPLPPLHKKLGSTSLTKRCPISLLSGSTSACWLLASTVKNRCENSVTWTFSKVKNCSVYVLNGSSSRFFLWSNQLVHPCSRVNEIPTSLWTSAVLVTFSLALHHADTLCSILICEKQFSPAKDVWLATRQSWGKSQDK